MMPGSEGKETFLVFDIGGTKIASAFVTMTKSSGIADDGGGTTASTTACTNSSTYGVHDFAKIPTDAKRGGSDVLRRLVEWTVERLDTAERDGFAIQGIGIGSAGVVDSVTGSILTATNTMPGWAGSHVVEEIRHGLGTRDIPIHMVGDVGAHGLGEALFGAGTGYRTVLSVGVGTGIGGAIITEGKLIQGTRGVAGHVGHMTHGLGEGVECSCGSHAGHIEPVASGTGLATLYNLRREQLLELSVRSAAHGAEVVERMNNGEDFARSIVIESATALGECIGGMGNFLDPDIIVLSGSVTQAGDVWWNAVREGFQRSALPLVAHVPLVQGTLGDDAPLVGAAVAVQRFIRDSRNG